MHNWHPISYRFRVIAAYCSNFGHCVFEPRCIRLSSSEVRFYTENGRFAFFIHLWGLETTYDDYLRFIGKHIVDFLLVLTKLFSLGVTAEALQANIGSKSAFFFQWGRLTQNHIIGDKPFLWSKPKFDPP